MTLQQQLESAVSHHQAGRLAEAEAIYRQLLSQHPNHVEALNLLGTVAAQLGRLDAAEEFIRRAIRLKPDYADGHYNLGIVLQNRGRRDEAIASYRQATRLKPGYAAAYNNLGVVLKAAGRFDDAIAAYRQAIRLKPDFADAHNNLANALKDKGQPDQAIVSYRHAIRIKPDSAEAHYNLGTAFSDNRQFDDAIAAYRQAIRLNPDFAAAHYKLGITLQIKGQLDETIVSYRHAIRLQLDLAEAHSNLGNALRDKGQLDEAIAAYRHAIRLRPDLAEAYANLGNAVRDAGRLDEAIESYRHAIRLNPALAEAHNNLGTALKDMGQLDEAIAAFQQAIHLKPDLADAHTNLAMALLTVGNFQRGLAEYEWRRKIKSMWTAPAFSQPQWMGEELAGRTILLFTDQGFGDAIQFSRYVPLVARRGGRIIINCPAELARLFRRLPDVAEIAVNGPPIPPFDVHCPLIALPRIFATDLNSIPAAIPYLTADPALVEKWSHRLGPADGRMRVGLAWAGNPAHSNDRNRSIQPQQLLPLAQVSNAALYSLQKSGPASHAPPPELKLIDFTPELADFADTAALIENLDLVVTVDTAVAHLSGAIGKPTWVLLPFAPDWRWLLDRQDSPWYPTMRLFRQRAIGDWAGVVQRLAEALPTQTARP